MKRFWMKCLKCICFVGIFIILFLTAQELLQPKWLIGSKDNTASTSTFMEYRKLEQDTIDVLFVGTSHVLYAVDPMLLYEATGITSYVFSGPGLRFDLTYLSLKEALKTQSPEVVFLDASGLQFDFQQDEAKARKMSDHLPITLEKIEYAFNNENEELDPLSVLFPLFRYHSRWEKVSKKDLQYMTDTLEPTFMRGHFASFDQISTELHFDSEEPFEITEKNRDYFSRMVKLCKENEITLIMMKIPTPEWKRPQSEAAAALAAEYDIPYWELTNEMEAIGLDTNTDYRDATDHLNQYGAVKFTAYMGKRISEEKLLSHPIGKIQQWDDELPLYHDRLEMLKKQHDEKMAEEQNAENEQQETEQQMQAEQEEDE